MSADHQAMLCKLAIDHDGQPFGMQTLQSRIGRGYGASLVLLNYGLEIGVIQPEPDCPFLYNLTDKAAPFASKAVADARERERVAFEGEVNKTPGKYRLDWNGDYYVDQATQCTYEGWLMARWRL
jgi:hypothetical protein